MGIGNDLIVEDLKKNSEEIAKKQARGERLSFENWIKLILRMGFLLCSIAFSIIIIKILFSIL